MYDKSIVNVADLYSLKSVDKDKYIANLKAYFDYLIEKATQNEDLFLGTIYARISFLSTNKNLPKDLIRIIHKTRNELNNVNITSELDILTGLEYSVLGLLQHHFKKSIEPFDFNKIAKAAQMLLSKASKGAYTDVIACAIHSVDDEGSMMTIMDRVEGVFKEVNLTSVVYKAAYLKTMAYLSKNNLLPIEAHLIDCEIDDFISPKSIVLLPDFLLDVTSIAECFKPTGVYPMSFILSRYLPRTTNKYILIGNLANDIFDHLMEGKRIEFNVYLLKFFKKNALALSTFSNQEVMEVLYQGKQIYQHIISDVNKIIKEKNQFENHLEPSYISEIHGLQGRLDLLRLNERGNEAQVYELKSGRPYKPNQYGLNKNNYVQTLLYGLLVKHAYGNKFDLRNHVYYCKIKENRIKFAPTIKKLQYEALQVRNSLVSMNLTNISNDISEPHFLELLNIEKAAIEGGYFLKDIQYTKSKFDVLDMQERLYFRVFNKLLLMEHFQAKVGSGSSNRNGLADLWRLSSAEKAVGFSLASDLILTQNKLINGNRTIDFQVSDRESVTNFRKGDIVLLYPQVRNNNTTRGQLIKGSILEIDSHIIIVKLRNEHVNDNLFFSESIWNMETDFLESSSNNALRSLTQFMFIEKDKRQLFMGNRPPVSNEINYSNALKKYNLNPTIETCLEKALQAEEYFLLWGPPGTGKTSVVLKTLVQYLIEQSDEQLLIVAYTNRAVDEICQCLMQCADLVPFMSRIGSRTAAAESVSKHVFFTHQTEQATSREQIIELLSTKRIILGTVASILGASDIFKLLKFDRLIVDEAGQILEPYLLGLLSHAKKTVLIGDHKQLPAVVASGIGRHKVDIQALLDIGLKNAAMSLFERLYRLARKNDWSYAYGQLIFQGRMDEDIMNFVGKEFYEGRLKKYVDALALSNSDQLNKLTPFVNQLNYLHIDEHKENSILLNKISEKEADAVVALIQSIASDRNEDCSLTVGVICPFRAQIALIKKRLSNTFNEFPKWLTIDTVERYQGGARDVIILSTCAQNLRTFESIHSLDADGDDRKLNVAVSRARHHFVLIGNKSVLESDATYRRLLEGSSLI